MFMKQKQVYLKIVVLILCVICYCNCLQFGGPEIAPCGNDYCKQANDQAHRFKEYCKNHTELEICQNDKRWLERRFPSGLASESDMVLNFCPQSQTTTPSGFPPHRPGPFIPPGHATPRPFMVPPTTYVPPAQTPIPLTPYVPPSPPAISPTPPTHLPLPPVTTKVPANTPQPFWWSFTKRPVPPGNPFSSFTKRPVPQGNPFSSFTKKQIWRPFERPTKRPCRGRKCRNRGRRSLTCSAGLFTNLFKWIKIRSTCGCHTHKRTVHKLSAFYYGAGLQYKAWPLQCPISGRWQWIDHVRCRALYCGVGNHCIKLKASRIYLVTNVKPDESFGHCFMFWIPVWYMHVRVNTHCSCQPDH